MKRQENRAVIAWREAASAGLVSSADSAYMKNSRPPSNAPTCGQSVPKMWYPEKQIFFSQNWNGREAILGLSRLDCLSARTGGTVNGGAFMRRSSCR